MIPGVGSVATFAADLLLPQSLVSLRPSEYTCPGQHRGFDKGQSITQKEVKTGKIPVIAGGKTIAYS